MEENGWMMNAEGRKMVKWIKECINGLIAAAVMALIIYVIVILWMMNKPEIQAAFRTVQGWII